MRARVAADRRSSHGHCLPRQVDKPMLDTEMPSETLPVKFAGEDRVGMYVVLTQPSEHKMPLLGIGTIILRRIGWHVHLDCGINRRNPGRAPRLRHGDKIRPRIKQHRQATALCQRSFQKELMTAMKRRELADDQTVLEHGACYAGSAIPGYRFEVRTRGDFPASGRQTR